MIKREELEAQILEKYSELRLINLKNLKKQELESFLENDKFAISRESLLRILAERNERADINKKLNNDNFGLRAKVKSITRNMTDWSKSEIVLQFKNIFGKVKKEDDTLLKEIGAISTETVKEDLEKSEKVVDDALRIANGYRKKYGELEKKDIAWKNKIKVKTEDDTLLKEIGAVSTETVKEDLEKSEKIVDDALKIAEAYRKKYKDSGKKDIAWRNKIASII